VGLKTGNKVKNSGIFFRESGVERSEWLLGCFSDNFWQTSPIVTVLPAKFFMDFKRGGRDKNRSGY
jgi:hypothetical protein